MAGPAVAAAVGRATVPVRVDADARPDICGRYHLGACPYRALDGRGYFVRGGTFLRAAVLGFSTTRSATGERADDPATALRRRHEACGAWSTR